MPVDDRDDRNALCSIRYNMLASALYPGNTEFRKMVIEEIRRLVDKFPGGYEEWEKTQSPDQVDEGTTKGPETVQGGGVASQFLMKRIEGVRSAMRTTRKSCLSFSDLLID